MKAFVVFAARKDSVLGKSADSSEENVIPEVVSSGESTNEIEDMSKFLSLDCEFVGVGPKKISALGKQVLPAQRSESFANLASFGL